jgi:protein AbiQ
MSRTKNGLRVRPQKEIPNEDKDLVRTKSFIFMNSIELRKLGDKFYKDYPKDLYPEFERKKDRPYVVLIISIFENKFAIPFRSNIKHSFCYRFKKTNRKTKSFTGLDYSKCVIVNNQEYLGEIASIDNKEYAELDDRYFFIIKKFKNYALNFIKFLNNPNNEDLQEMFKFSTLNYYRDLFKNKSQKKT